MGIYDKDTLRHTWRLNSIREKTKDEYGTQISALFEAAGISTSVISGAAISCVVPKLTGTIKEALSEYLGIDSLVIGPGVKTTMPIMTDNPREVGADRIVNAVGAYSEHKSSLIVVDFGTAVTFDYVTEKGEYAGGAIAPGIVISSDALFSRAAKLSRVEVEKPTHVIGKNTQESMQAGIYFGYAGLVSGIVERMKKEAGSCDKVIATGGQASILLNDITL
ncbi:MAG: type III pantothenate kinase, partial [Deltaproteobacteria bacterium]|nr:type III pantothenate kinase [Deltaproteobacteria bacterium]